MAKLVINISCDNLSGDAGIIFYGDFANSTSAEMLIAMAIRPHIQKALKTFEGNNEQTLNNPKPTDGEIDKLFGIA